MHVQVANLGDFSMAPYNNLNLNILLEFFYTGPRTNICGFCRLNPRVCEKESTNNCQATLIRGNVRLFSGGLIFASV